eukprot:5540971-Alexandrium_andersonii.AAC.1
MKHSKPSTLTQSPAQSKFLTHPENPRSIGRGPAANLNEPRSTYCFTKATMDRGVPAARLGAGGAHHRPA